MVQQSAAVDRVFHALGDPARRAMIDRLSRGPASVSELAAPFSMTLAAVVQHVRVLEDSGVITTEKVGRVRTCQLAPRGLSAAEQWISERRALWERRLDRLAAFLDEDDEPDLPRTEASPLTEERKEDPMSNAPITHSTFTIKRKYKSSPARVFAAWADPAQKRRWFVAGEGWTIDSYEADIREGGYERSRFRYQGGPEITNETIHHEILQNRRIISSYGMTVAGKRLSVSLATLEFEPSGSGTLLRYTEQAAFYEGGDGADGRREGCAGLLEKLAEELGESA